MKTGLQIVGVFLGLGIIVLTYLYAQTDREPLPVQPISVMESQEPPSTVQQAQYVEKK